MPFEEQASDGQKMNLRHTSWIPPAMFKQIVALFLLPQLLAAGQAEIGKSVRTIEQRLMLASHMIERMDQGDRGCLPRQLEALQARFLEEIDERLVADSHAFFGRVMRHYRALAGNRSGTDNALYKSRYDEKRLALDTFSQSFSELVAERGEPAEKALAQDVFLARVARADELAGMKRYQEAYAIADGAYHQLIEAMRRVRNRETVEYRLEFKSISEEFAYEKRRFNSQKMLLEMLVAEKQPPRGSVQLIDAYVTEAGRKSSRAQRLAEHGDYENALMQQEAAVEDLTRAMRVAGIYF